jgi:5-oxoprolinase (ATP-hydrolysing) subunit A
MRSIDLNCDLGDGPSSMSTTEGLLSLVSSANVACGIHAGDPFTVAANVRLAVRHGVAIGAHPGLPDREGFGRRPMEATPQEAYALVLYQIGAVDALARAEGARLHHVKPHGALYNIAARDRSVAEAIALAVKAFDPMLTVVGLSGSELLSAAGSAGLRSASEVFADRTYQADGSLTPRSQSGALIDDEQVAAAQVLQMVLHGSVRARDGRDIPMHAETVCLHGDGPHATALARLLRTVLNAANIEVKAFS